MLSKFNYIVLLLTVCPFLYKSQWIFTIMWAFTPLLNHCRLTSKVHEHSEMPKLNKNTLELWRNQVSMVSYLTLKMM